MGDNGEAGHEVLLLSREQMQEGTLYLREVVFGSDHLVFTRVSWLDDPEDG